ncbi:hypothetical protein ACLOJK_006799 [Asimina triloba]
MELQDLERQICSIDEGSSQAEDLWLGDRFGVSPNMGVDKHRKIIGAEKHPKEMSVTQVSKEEMGRRVNHAAALEAKEHLKEDVAGLLLDLAITRAKQDEAVNGAQAAKVKASGLSAELVASRSEAKALRAHGVNSDVKRAKSHAGLEVARGEVSLLHGQVALLRSREAKLHSESKVAQVEASQPEMAHLQATSSRRDDAQSSTIAKYLRSDVYQ